ncbi:MAG: hypothetical protein MK105_15735 [Crocinitomicaceae bacterium]|nr:hypothetical protein [Crocinitomicaceae bacterium]
MKRLFQHYEGEIQGLIGKELKNLKSLHDKNDNDVILIWLESGNSWFRVFIDGVYCGVDEYENDESIYDVEEDDDLLIEHKKWVNGMTINKAKVESWVLPEIKLTLELSSDTKLILKCDKNEFCSLNIIE